MAQYQPSLLLALAVVLVFLPGSYLARVGSFASLPDLWIEFGHSSRRGVFRREGCKCILSVNFLE